MPRLPSCLSLQVNVPNPIFERRRPGGGTEELNAHRDRVRRIVKPQINGYGRVFGTDMTTLVADVRERFVTGL